MALWYVADSTHVEIWTCIFSALHNTVVDLRVPVPDEWIDSLFPGVRRILECVKVRNARLQSAKPQAEDRVSDRAAEASCKLCCMLAFAFGRTCRSGQNGMCKMTGLVKEPGLNAK